MLENSNSNTDKKSNKPLVNKDLELFNALFRDNYSSLFNYVLKLSNDSNIAKDVVQEAYIKLWEKRGSLNFNSEIKNYLFKICHNEFLMHLRKKNKETSLLDDLKHSIAYETYSVNTDLESKKIKIENALKKLPNRTKEAFFLSRYEKLKYKEIAIKMDISIKTVEKHISKALYLLKTNVKSIFF